MITDSFNYGVNPVVVKMPPLKTSEAFLILRAAIFQQSLDHFNYGVNPVVALLTFLKLIKSLINLELFMVSLTIRPYNYQTTRRPLTLLLLPF
jgi:hypothetical protein